jgi:hypothetical protein
MSKEDKTTEIEIEPLPGEEKYPDDDTLKVLKEKPIISGQAAEPSKPSELRADLIEAIKASLLQIAETRNVELVSSKGVSVQHKVVPDGFKGGIELTQAIRKKMFQAIENYSTQHPNTVQITTKKGRLRKDKPVVEVYDAGSKEWHEIKEESLYFLNVIKKNAISWTKNLERESQMKHGPDKKTGEEMVKKGGLWKITAKPEENGMVVEIEKSTIAQIFQFFTPSFPMSHSRSDRYRWTRPIRMKMIAAMIAKQFWDLAKKGKFDPSSDSIELSLEDTTDHDNVASAKNKHLIAEHLRELGFTVKVKFQVGPKGEDIKSVKKKEEESAKAHALHRQTKLGGLNPNIATALYKAPKPEETLKKKGPKAQITGG